MISSAQAGVRGITDLCDAFFLALADHSPPRKLTLSGMIVAWRESRPAIVQPRFEGKHGHPILIPSSLAPEILALTSDQTLASIVKRHSSDAREVIANDPAILEDIDTPDDYNRALRRWKEIA